MKFPQEINTAGREFARRYINILCELRLQPGIRQRVELIMSDFADEHPNLRASYISREVDEAYFPVNDFPPEALTQPSLQGLALEGEQLYEFISFSQGLRTEVMDLNSIVDIQEVWLEPKQDLPFLLRISILHRFPAATILIANSGEAQDMAREFIGRLKYLRGW